MAKKPNKLKARLPRGFLDRSADDIRATDEMIGRIRAVYEKYGFDPVETPAFEFTDCLGKFLPDTDRPNAGVFSVQDEDDQWMSLRYDLTAPLARHVSENINEIQLPYRTYRAGWVFRNEKPGPGRFRQFMQFDADTVGAPGVQADAEMCMMFADTMEALGIARGQYVIRVNNRKVLDGVLESIGLGGEENDERRLTVLRAIDKLDKFGIEGVRLLLGEGRKDESGDFTKGAGLDASAIEKITDFVSGTGSLENDGIAELNTMAAMFKACGYEEDRIKIDPSVVRGLEYYTGPVYEAELLFDVTNEKGEVVQFGSVGGGGRYDGLVKRFTGRDVPATGFSMGVTRLMTALKNLGKLGSSDVVAPVLVTVMDGDVDALGRYQKMVQDLRSAGIRAEMYQGNWKKFGNQLKYADRRNCPIAIIQGSDERGVGELQIKDLIEGKRLSEEITDNITWRESRPAQITVKEADLVETVRGLLDAQADDRRRQSEG
ncbi:histidine--tRNA ligase [Roseibium sp. HPY-6]|uniref:histidine--tRNA ligase n=1 Tax=Roseibium sp. HPY-6 TaxID=3229852 RepID=UPI00338E1723